MSPFSEKQRWFLNHWFNKKITEFTNKSPHPKYYCGTGFVKKLPKLLKSITGLNQGITGLLFVSTVTAWNKLSPNLLKPKPHFRIISTGSFEKKVFL